MKTWFYQKVLNQFLTKSFLLQYKRRKSWKSWKPMSNSLLTICLKKEINVHCIHFRRDDQNELYKIGFDHQTNGSTWEEIDAEALEADQLLVRALTRQ